MSSENPNESKQTWTDGAGNVYSTRVDMSSAVALRSAGYDLKDSQSIGRWFADPYSAMDFCLALLRPRIEELGLSDLEFMDLATHNETSFAELVEAMQRGLIDFFRRCGDQPRARVVEKAVAFAGLAKQQSLALIDGEKTDAAVNAVLARGMQTAERELERIISGATFGDSSEKPESRPSV